MGESVFLVSIVLLLSTLGFMALHRLWLKPKKTEKYLKKQGIKGPPYKLFYGTLIEEKKMMKEARSKTLGLSHDIVPRLFPFIHQTIKEYVSDLTAAVGELVEQLRLTNLAKASASVKRRGHSQRRGRSRKKGVMEVDGDEDIAEIDSDSSKLSVTWFGTSPRVIIMDPEIVKEIMSNKFGHYRKLKKNPFWKLLALGTPNYEGEKWVKHRRIVNPAFHLEKLKGMLPAFSTSCSELVSKWEKLVETDSSCELDMWPDLQNLTADIISRTSFGSCFEEGRKIFQLQTEQAELVTQTAQSLYFPGFWFLPTKRNKRMKKIDKEVRAALRGIINKREKALKLGEDSKDLLGLLMESNYKEIRENGNSKNVGLSIEEVIEECKAFYLAGQETTAVLLTWTMVVLSMHQDWQVRAREEVLHAFGKAKPDFDGLNHLKVVTLILYEVLRLYPSAIMLLRQTCKNVKLGDLTLPAGIELGLPTLLIHQDPEFWGVDAKEFNPGRFSEGVSKATNNQTSYFPFGLGPRTCIGQNFAMVEAKMALVLILQHFWFELSSNYVHAPRTIITLQPQYGAQIILHKL
ncbi:hypothetical protein GIB67_000680 [Kingdonia uniflora]|uniref:Cytochrome P450 n=1 Tax=Kingdonia uniflora TaxID=39325 RepID=A0A7J7ND48_9MAGN|nr:hypothetical protein GIB67_000680 [Kingdonia uniflora]